MTYQHNVLRVINGLALAAALLWLVFQPDWEPAVTSLALLATFIGLLYAKGTSHHDSSPQAHARAAAPEFVEKWVDLKYPSDSGLQARLEAVGYRVAWCLDNKLSRKLDLEGWEIVVEPDQHGASTRFRLKDRPDNQTLIKKR